MRKLLTLLKFLFGMNVCFGQLHLIDENSCQTNDFDTLDWENISTRLLGDWVYSYSYYEDSCFYLSELKVLSKSYSFKIGDTSIIRSTLPKLFNFGYGKPLFGLESSHEAAPFGDKSYPIANSSLENAKKLNFLFITHYVGNGPGKAYTYRLNSVSNDTLVISNRVYYNLGERKVAGVMHVYFKRK